MSAKATFGIPGGDQITFRLQSMTRNVKSNMSVYFKTTLYKQYQAKQLARWKSGGTGSQNMITSEGDRWAALKPDYLRYKQKKFPAYGGNQILVATGALLKSVVGPGNGQIVKIDSKSITISTAMDYAKHVNADRPFTGFGKATLNEMKAGIMAYIKRKNA